MLHIVMLDGKELDRDNWKWGWGVAWGVGRPESEWLVRAVLRNTLHIVEPGTKAHGAQIPSVLAASSSGLSLL